MADQLLPTIKRGQAQAELSDSRLEAAALRIVLTRTLRYFEAAPVAPTELVELIRESLQLRL